MTLTFCFVYVGESAIKRLKENNMEDYLDLLRGFEIKKRTGGNSKVTIKLPLSLLDHVGDLTGLSLKNKLASSSYGKEVCYVVVVLKTSYDYIFE